ncbi:MAG: hypothetical protein V1927_03760 [Candidatus Omnitrophota bacterium]
MVKNTFDKSLDILELKTVIENRLQKYYPHLASSHVRVEGSLLKKHHKSIIYQFSIYNTDSVLKRLIVKRRIYNNLYHNDVTKDTVKEFDILSLLRKNRVLKDSISHALDAIPEKGLLVTEKIEGETLYAYLKNISLMPLTRSRKAILKSLFSETGEWLKDFHSATFEGKHGKIETGKFIDKAGQIIDKFPYLNIPVDLGRKVMERMEALESDVASYDCPISLKHGDFQPHNIIHNGSRIYVLDIAAEIEDLTIKDVCNFITGLNISMMKLPGLSFKERYLNGMVGEYLKAYYGGGEAPYSVIRFVRILGILEQLDSVYKRNPNYLRRKIITRFYAGEMKNLVTK